MIYAILILTLHISFKITEIQKTERCIGIRKTCRYKNKKLK